MINIYAFILTQNYAGKQWAMSGDEYSGITWLDDAPISQDELEGAYKQYLVDYGHVEEREKAYPAISDQLDMLWHAMDIGEIPKASTFYDVCKAVKDKYPKGAK